VTQEAFTPETPARLSATIFERLNAAEGSSSIYILWGFFAFAAVAAAIAVCFTPGAERRISTAISIPSDQSRSPALARLDAARAAEPAPDAATLARLKALEEQIGSMTGSIDSASPPPQQVASSVTPTAPRQVQTESIALEGQADTSPTRTMFGVDLGSESSFGALRMRWDNLRRQYPELSRLSPRISVRDNKGKVELRLIAGPFENAADAAKACAGLLSKGAVCDGGLFDGQRLPAS
jgi:hypothetical protein